MRHAAWCLPALLLGGSLSGCVAVEDGGRRVVGSECVPPPGEPRGEDWSNETLRITIEALGDFAVDVPVPVSPNGTAADWFAGALVPLGWNVSIVATDKGEALRIGGRGAGTLRSCSIRVESPRGYAEQYLDARWTMPGPTREQVHVHVASGAVDVALAYRAESNWCGGDAAYAGRELAAGWHMLEGAHSMWCE